MAIIRIGNVHDRNDRRVLRAKEVLDGKTYMNLRVLVCPAGGSFDVCVEALDQEEESLQIMVMGLLFSAIAEEDDTPPPVDDFGAPYTVAPDYE